MNRTKVGLIFAATLVTAFTLVPLTASAISPEQECELAGGTFTKEKGTQTCTFVETPGKNQGGVTKTETESQKGSSRSAHPEEEEDCVVNRGGTHC